MRERGDGQATKGREGKSSERSYLQAPLHSNESGGGGGCMKKEEEEEERRGEGGLDSLNRAEHDTRVHLHASSLMLMLKSCAICQTSTR